MTNCPSRECLFCVPAGIPSQSAATHQLVFMLRSCVPGAVGQVQDVGLIFLSAMASSVVEAGRQDGAAFADTMATCLVLLSAATLAVGVLVIIVGEWRPSWWHIECSHTHGHRTAACASNGMFVGWKHDAIYALLVRHVAPLLSTQVVAIIHITLKSLAYNQCER